MYKRKGFRITLLILALIIVVIFAGPHPNKPVYKKDLPVVPSSAKELTGYVSANESLHKLKPGNEAQIVWFDSTQKPTDYAIVYLHGFSASQEEGNPVHRDIAKTFGCNLYLSRLAEHGIDTTEPMYHLTADKYWESAQQALATGEQLGKKIILVATSTGGTNALQLAATYPAKIAALILLSPNIAINNKDAWLLNNAWGAQIAKLVTGSDHVIAKDQRDIYKKYWYSSYSIKAATELQELLETTMRKETFEKVTQPTLMLYYYKDDVHQDSVVRVDAMLKMFDQLGSPSNLKFKKAIPNAGDHVIGSYIKSHDVASVEAEIKKFMIEVLHIPLLSKDE